VGFDPSLREEAKSLAGISALLDSKDLYFQTLSPSFQEFMKLQPAEAADGA
jgi:hypothetical protein